MGAELIPFDFEEQAVRVVVIDGEPWFVAADVCRVLERVAPDRILDSHFDHPVIPCSGGRYGGQVWVSRILLSYVNGRFCLLSKAARTPRRRGACVFPSSSSMTWCGSSARLARLRQSRRAIRDAAS